MINALMNYANKKEARESRDEVVYGEIIAAMARRGFPAIGFNTGSSVDTGYQSVTFSTPSDPLLHTVRITLDRKTGGGAISEKMMGSKATLTMRAEVKNFLADPDDLLKMWKTDFANIARVPMLGQVKVNHELNSIFATKGILVELTDFDGPEDRSKIEGVLGELYTELRGVLQPYKHQSTYEQSL